MPAVPRNEDTNERPGRSLATQVAKTVAQRTRIDWPAPRGSWSDDVIDSYYAFQGDVTAQAVRGVDIAAVMRYFDLLEVQGRIFEELISENSMMQDTDQGFKSHPLISSFAQMVRTSLALAQHIGATPMSRVKLGLVNAEGALLQRALEDELGGALEETAPHLIEKDHAAQVDPDADVVEAEILEEY